MRRGGGGRERGGKDEGEGIEFRSCLRTLGIMSSCHGNFPPLDQSVIITPAFIPTERGLLQSSTPQINAFFSMEMDGQLSPSSRDLLYLNILL